MPKPKTLTIRLPLLHPAQQQVQRSAARFKVLCCARRWGKSRLGALVLLARALHGGQCWWVAPSYATGQIGFDEVRRLGAQIPGTEINRSERFVALPGGGRVTVKSADDPALLRGFSLDMVVFDEAAHTSRLEEIWVEVIRPALADRSGSAMFCSTPRGKNYFHTLYQQGLDPLQPDWQSWQFPTSSNPHIPTSEVAAMKLSMPELKFRQEVLAQFVEDGSVFRNVSDLMSPAYAQQAPIPGHEYTVGVDLARVAGGDATVYAMYDATEGDICALERFSGQEYSIQASRLQVLIEKWKPVSVVIETNSAGQSFLEEVKRRVPKARLRGFTTTNQSKSEMVNAFALACEREEVGLLEDPILKGELQSFEAAQLPSGLTKYAAPVGQHDDCVMAVLLAWSAGQYTGPVRRYKTAKAGVLDY